MKKKWIAIVGSGVLIIGLVVAGASFAKSDDGEVRGGTIRLENQAEADFPAMAKITRDQAVQKALAAVQGQVLKTELEDENGFLVYGVEVVTADKAIVDVKVGMPAQEKSWPWSGTRRTITNTADTGIVMRRTTSTTATGRTNQSNAPRTSFLKSVGARFNRRRKHAASILSCDVFAMISIENLYLTIGGKEILKGIGLHLQPGDIYGLLGPNGAGKSTTIFALLGLRAHGSGQISVLGRDPGEHAAAIRSTVGVMPEHAGFYDWMTAPAYLRWYGRLYGQTPTGRDLRMLLEKVGLGAEGHRPIGTYSRGMKQRLAVARALIPHPRLLILDEPTNGLDPKGRREIHDLLLEFAAEGNAGVLLCTHLLDDVDRLCNRIGIIDQGRTRLEGRLGDLLAEQGAGQHYRLRLEAEPKTSNIPTGVSLLAHEGDWWRVQIQSKTSEGPSVLWGELWQRGWRILEIRSEASSLEELYLNITGRDHARVQEAAI
jgi:ABC-2 type transport system ATP-binding protein